MFLRKVEPLLFKGTLFRFVCLPYLVLQAFKDILHIREFLLVGLRDLICLEL